METIKWTEKYKSRWYFIAQVIDIGITLLVYHFFGFNIAILVILAMISSDIGYILKRLMNGA